MFFVLSVQEYDTHMHKLTQAGHCRDCHPRGTRAERGPSALPPSVPLRARGRSARHCGSPFPKGKTDQTHPPSIHTLTGKPQHFSPETSPIPSLGMVFPTWDSGESHGKDQSKGLPTSSSPWPSAAGGVAIFTSCLQPKNTLDGCGEGAAHRWGGKKKQKNKKNTHNPTLPPPLKKTPPF